MTFDSIEQAFGLRLAALDQPVAWPNQDFTPNGTYIEFRHAPSERYDDTIDATGAIQTGIILLTVVIRAGGFATEANTIAQAIADLFPKALRIPAGTGNVVCYAPSALGTPFQDGAYWRQPVRVFYVTE